ncbi:VOC family protein [Micromonospora citrea]|uniref:VOC family protein n=1 Tax=Micromonospora citrea TaxID=47855 RepID=UPI003CCC132F
MALAGRSRRVRSLLEIEVDDPGGVAERMVAHGAKVVVPVENRPYGKRSGRIRDPFGPPLDRHRRATVTSVPRPCS